jgi:pimeloyl-ACP methyl ester carboxylesterase
VAELVVEGVRLRYEVRGQGRPILLLHGFSSSYRGTWQNTGWVDLLVERGFATIGLDLRGHGQSDKPHDPASDAPERLAGDALAVLDALDVRSADVLGYSLGGGVALRLAMEHPRRVRSVVVGGVGDAALNRLADPAELAAIADPLDPATDVDVLSPQARRLRENALRAGSDLRALAACMRNGRGWPGGLDELPPIAVPVLLVVAEHDQYMRGHRVLLGGIPNAEAAEIPGRDHHTVVPDPRFKRAVLAFLTRSGEGSVRR